MPFASETGTQYESIHYCAEEFSYPVDSAFAILHVARSAYYKWLNGTPCVRQTENGRIAKIVEDIHMESPDKGYRRIRDDLNDTTIQRSATNESSVSAGLKVLNPPSSTLTTVAPVRHPILST